MWSLSARRCRNLAMHSRAHSQHYLLRDPAMKEKPLRTIEIAGRELRLPTGAHRLSNKATIGWQYVWHANERGCNRFFGDMKYGGPLESFKELLRCVAEHP